MLIGDISKKTGGNKKALTEDKRTVMNLLLLSFLLLTHMAVHIQALCLLIIFALLIDLSVCMFCNQLEILIMFNDSSIEPNIL